MEKFQNINHLAVKLQSTLPQYEKLLTIDYGSYFRKQLYTKTYFFQKQIHIDRLINLCLIIVIQYLKDLSINLIF
jgi:hypothetical protein